MTDFREMTIYQIYPKSFQDSNGDGIGDLAGVISRLDYLAELGVDMIWLSPFYPSPQYDNGYDVSDYRAVDLIFGTMEDFERLVAEVDQRGMAIMLDMVFNHTSTEHEWFQQALAGDPDYQDYYYLRPAQADGSLPTNWESKFGGPAWEPFGDTDLYYLHLYDVHQADLNWHNPRVRQELQAICNFWLEKGVKGFRFDVLNVIGKDPVLVDSDKSSDAQEKALYTDTPRVHDWVRKLNQASFGHYSGVVTVGEMSSTNIEDGILYTRPDRDELDMIFQFHHLKVDYEKGDKWTNPDFDFIALKQILNDWQEGTSDGGGWLALFLNNHDQPRANSRFGDVENYPYETATMLAQTTQLMRGTPYIYQGEELGMTNPNYEQIEDYNDIETQNNYQILLEKGLEPSEALAIIQAKSRDNARSPMQWDDSAHAGFTSGEPWLRLADNYRQVNAQKELAEGRIFAYYQDLIRLRKEYPVVSRGSYQGWLLEDPEVMVYSREYEGQTLLVLSHFYSGDYSFSMPEELQAMNLNGASKLLGNGPLDLLSSEISLGAYETAAFLLG